MKWWLVWVDKNNIPYSATFWKVLVKETPIECGLAQCYKRVDENQSYRNETTLADLAMETKT